MRENDIKQCAVATGSIENIPIKQLRPFENQPFQVLMDGSMYELAESVKGCGVLTPITVRPHLKGGYEILSGHRRVKACEMAGKSRVPAKILDLDDDMAIIFLVESNLQREHLLPSEKAYAYRMRMEAMKRQGLRTDLTPSQFGTKFRSDEILAKEIKESRNQIHRYIRLTNLIDALLNLVDVKKVPVNAAVELSYLGTKAQADIAAIMERDEVMVSLKQAKEIRAKAQEGKIATAAIESILQEREQIHGNVILKEKEIRQYFPEGYTKRQMEAVVLSLLEQWSAVQRKKNRG